MNCKCVKRFLFSFIAHTSEKSHRNKMFLFMFKINVNDITAERKDKNKFTNVCAMVLRFYLKRDVRSHYSNSSK